MDIKRINPRRPWRITAEGLKRIVLGAVGDIPQGEAPVAKQAGKPLRTPPDPSAWVLAIVHSERGVLDDHARQVIAAAAILANAATAVAVLVLGELHENLGEAGADRVFVAPELDFQRFQPESELACVLAVMDELTPQHVYLPDNAIGDGDLGRRLIAHLGSRSTAATHVAEIDADHVAVYQAGGSRLAATALPDIVLLAKDAVEARLPFVGAGERESWHADKTVTGGCLDLGMDEIDAAQIALEEADFIVSAGNGVQHVTTIETLARLLDAAIGASRVAVDCGKFSRDKQIGATGKTVSASAYLAIGISGAVQHLQGIKDCRHVVAINRDAGAPIIKRANLSVIGDAEEIMQSLVEAIEAAKSENETSKEAV